MGAGVSPAAVPMLANGFAVGSVRSTSSSVGDENQAVSRRNRAIRIGRSSESHHRHQVASGRALSRGPSSSSTVARPTRLAASETSVMDEEAKRHWKMNRLPDGTEWSGRARYAATMFFYQRDLMDAETLVAYRRASCHSGAGRRLIVALISSELHQFSVSRTWRCKASLAAARHRLPEVSVSGRPCQSVIHPPAPVTTGTRAQ